MTNATTAAREMDATASWASAESLGWATLVLHARLDQVRTTRYCRLAWTTLPRHFLVGP